MSAASRKASTGAKKTRVQGVTGSQQIKATGGPVHRIIVANADAAAQTVTVTDGGTTQIVLKLGIGESKSFEFGVIFAGAIAVNPSNANLDILVIFD